MLSEKGIYRIIQLVLRGILFMKSKNQIQDRDYYISKAVNYFRSGYICAQAVLLAMQEFWQVQVPVEPKIASAFGAGIGRRGSLCGALTGGILAISWVYGTNNPSSEERQPAYALALDYYNRFHDKCGSVFCHELIGYDLTNPEQQEAARQANIYMDRCVQFIEDAISLLMSLTR
jgi:C_GCAxxG_C_C family probable redox protein